MRPVQALTQASRLRLQDHASEQHVRRLKRCWGQFGSVEGCCMMDSLCHAHGVVRRRGDAHRCRHCGHRCMHEKPTGRVARCSQWAPLTTVLDAPKAARSGCAQSCNRSVTAVAQEHLAAAGQLCPAKQPAGCRAAVCRVACPQHS